MGLFCESCENKNNNYNLGSPKSNNNPEKILFPKQFVNYKTQEEKKQKNGIIIDIEENDNDNINKKYLKSKTAMISKKNESISCKNIDNNINISKIPKKIKK